MASPRTVVIPYQPRPLQLEFHDDFQRAQPRRSVLVCHRRFGKSVMTINELVRQAAQCPRPNPRYAYVAPYRHQAKAIAWDFLKQYTQDVPGVSYNESELRCDLPWGARLTLFGADNADALRGMYLDGVVLDEYAFMHPDVFEKVISPTLVDRDGFALFIGTPNGRNHFHALYEQTQAEPESLTRFWPASKTGVLSAERLAEEQRRVAPEVFAQEYECSFEAAIKGAYYARQLEQARADGRLTRVPYEPARPVETWWDLGWSDATAILFVQQIGREVHVIDYLEDYGKELAVYAKALLAKPYLYAKHHLPHDAGHTELGSGLTLEQQLRRMGLRDTRVHGANEPLDGIHQARLLFPRVWIDSAKCARFIDALAAYRAAWDDNRQDYKDAPYHDWASHGADAFRCLAVGLRELKPEDGQGPGRAKLDYSALDYVHSGRSRATKPISRARIEFGV
jgi:phage terminase large subunit